MKNENYELKRYSSRRAGDLIPMAELLYVSQISELLDECIQLSRIRGKSRRPGDEPSAN